MLVTEKPISSGTALHASLLPEGFFLMTASARLAHANIVKLPELRL